MKHTLLLYPSYPLAELDNCKIRNIDRIMRPKRRGRCGEYRFAETLALSIEQGGMRNPLTVEWFAVIPQVEAAWTVRTGNNRWLALTHFLKRETARCLFVVPADREPPPGEYEIQSAPSAKALFDDDKVWRDSKILSRMLKNVP